MSEPRDGDRRNSLRLAGHDYGRPGWYFVTLTTCEFAPRFGAVVDGGVSLNAFGAAVADEWRRTPALRPNVRLDAFVVMPDHLHGIIAIAWARPAHSRPGAHTSPAQTLSAIVRGFKAAATRRVNELRATPGVPIWQRSFYDQVIRSRAHLDAVRRYIADNPAR
jgi:REP element-mobilizing transposase RayT